MERDVRSDHYEFHHEPSDKRVGLIGVGCRMPDIVFHV